MNNKQGFLDYINNPISKESIAVLYGSNNIKFEKCELYSDFVQSLLRLAFTTYMGDDVTTINQQIEHFNWCWNKNKENFLDEGLLFDNHKLYSYFLEFMLEVYYTAIDKSETISMDKNILKIWYNIFDYNRSKSNSDMDNLIEVYLLFESSLKLIV